MGEAMPAHANCVCVCIGRITNPKEILHKYNHTVVGSRRELGGY